MSGFAVICDARAGESLGVQTLALVDRSKSRSLWWTSDDPALAINYQREAAAKFAARRLKHNAARVVPFEQAEQLLREQSRQITYEYAMADSERGWDDHKGAR